MNSFRVVSVNVSDVKGCSKTPVDVITLAKEIGVLSDAHAGTGRQVSLLAMEDIRLLQSSDSSIGPGSLAENITVEGLDAGRLSVGEQLQVGEATIEITQIGKSCHSACEIKKRVGHCIMPTRGIFAKVLKEGVVRHEDIGTYGI